MLDRRLVEDVAARLRSDPGLVEKDWHVTRAIGVLAEPRSWRSRAGLRRRHVAVEGLGPDQALFRGHRFQGGDAAGISRNKARNERSAYRKRILAALTDAGFTLAGEPVQARRKPLLLGRSLLSEPVRHRPRPAPAHPRRDDR